MFWRANRWRTLWVVAFYLSLILLMTTGARTSILGFAAAAPFIAVLQWGKKAIIVCALALAVLAPVAWSTGAAQTFLQTCISRPYNPAGLAYLKIRSPQVEGSVPGTQAVVQPAQEPSTAKDQPVSNPLISTPAAESNLQAPDRGIILRRIDGEGAAGQESPAEIFLPIGEWSLKQACLSVLIGMWLV